jgi:inosine-uridine nucleoside N-ribohydrolase
MHCVISYFLYRSSINIITCQEGHRYKVLLDVDPGIDDAIAIIIAVRSKNIDVIGITTVNGNVGSRIGALNAVKVLRALGRSDIPVIKGATRPLVKRPIHAENIHGKGGLGGMHLELVREARNAVATKNVSDFVEDTLRNYRKHEVSMIATGPLTNIAKLLMERPLFASNIREISIMGGAFGVTNKIFGNITDYAEFNFYSDPEAAKIVMDSTSKLHIKIAGLDVTHNENCVADANFLAKLNNVKTPAARFAASLLNFAVLKHKFFYLHDVFAVAMLERPSVFKFRKGNIDVILNGKMRGHSKFNNEADNSGHLLVAVDIKEDGLKDYILRKVS